MAVYDAGRGGIELYSRAGEPLGRVRFPVRVEWTKGFAVLPSGDFVISGPIPGINLAVHRFGRDGRLLRSWGLPAQAKDWRARMIATGGAVHAMSSGYLLYSQGAPHRIVRYDFPPEPAEAVAERLVSAVDGVLDAPGDAVVVEEVGEDGQLLRSFNVGYPQSVAVFEMEGGLILNVIRIAEEGQSLWQLFDSGQLAGEARLLAEEQLAEAYLPWFKSPNGDILASRRDSASGVPVIARLRPKWSQLPR